MNLNFAKYDFADLLNQLNDLMRATVSWDSFKSGTGQMLMELYAYVGTLVGYYTERRAEESYLLTARNRSSLLNLAALVGYQPQLRTSASAAVPETGTAPVVVSIAAELVSSLTSSVVIPRGTSLQTVDGINFYVTDDAFIPADGVTSGVGVSVVQGLRVVKPPVRSTGAAQFSIILSEASIENTPPRVYVGAVQWTWVSTFKGCSPADTVYKTQVNADDSVTLLFGDGVRGAVPPSTLDIVVEYTVSDGLSGNVTTVGALNKVVDSVYLANDLTQSNPVTVTVTNNSSVLGGAEPETNEQIRDLAPAVFSTGDRAVTTADCRTIVNNLPGVTDCAFWGEYDVWLDSGTLDYTKMNTVYFSMVTDGWGFPTGSSSYVTAVENLLRSKGMMSVLYSFQQATEVDVVVQISVRATPTTNLTNLYASAVQVIQDEFELGVTSLLGVSKYASVLARNIQDLVGVVYVHLNMYVKQAIAPISAGVYGTASTPFAVLPGSIKVYLGDGAGGTVLAATDDGAGNLTFISPYSAQYSGTVSSYANGVIHIAYVAGSALPSGGNNILYQQNNTTAGMNGDLILGRTQIARIAASSDIQII